MSGRRGAALAAVALAAVGAVVLGRGGEAPARPGERPPDLQLGLDTCDECLMLVGEARFAAAYETEGGEVRRFDDLGDLLAEQRKRPEAVAAAWVHDYRDGQWLRAEQATFVRAPDLVTPMGSGLVAFRDAPRAAAFAEEQRGAVRSYEELQREPSEPPLRAREPKSTAENAEIR